MTNTAQGGGLTPLELNVGLAACGPAGDARGFFDMLGQGRADLYFAQQYARLARQWGDRAAAEARVYNLAGVSDFVWRAIRNDARIDDDKRADLLSFIFERGMNMPRATLESLEATDE